LEDLVDLFGGFGRFVWIVGLFPKFEGFDDCVELTHLNESAVFHKLNKRYQKDIIYTQVYFVSLLILTS